jgi:hypothetical protein
MAIKISTALRNYMLGAGSFKSAFADSHILLYSGSPPATADLGVTGTHLLTVTKASGTLAAGALSTPQMEFTGTISVAGGQYIGITIKDVEYKELYASSQIATIMALVNKINRTCPEMFAVVNTATPDVILLGPRAQGNSGEEYTVTNGGTSGATLTITGTGQSTFSVSTGLNFAAATVGTIDKPGSGVAVWSGLGLTAAGTGTSAGYFRLMRSDDTGVVDTTYIYERVQGTVGTSGSDLVLSSATIVSGATTTIDGFKFTLPETV